MFSSFFWLFRLVSLTRHHQCAVVLRLRLNANTPSNDESIPLALTAKKANKMKITQDDYEGKHCLLISN